MLSFGTLLPLSKILPLVGLSKPSISFTSVDFPLPEGPYSPMEEPLETQKFRSSIRY